MNEENTFPGSQPAPGPALSPGAPGSTSPQRSTGLPGSSGFSTSAGVSTAGESGSTTSAEQVKQSAQAEFQRMKGAAREQTSAAVDQLKEGAQAATQQAREIGRNFFQTQQSNLAQRVGEYAEAARAASDRLRGDQENLLAGPAATAAEQLDRFSHYLQNKQPADLLDDIESLARRRPEIVFGGLFVLGLAAARFLKASGRRRFEQRSEFRSSGPRSDFGPRDEFSQPEFQASAPMVTPAPVAAVPGEASQVPPSTSSTGIVDPLAGGSSLGGSSSSTLP